HDDRQVGELLPEPNIRNIGAPAPLAAATTDDAKPDQELLQGDWHALSIEGATGKAEGKGSEPDRFALHIEGNTIVFKGIYGMLGGDGKGTFTLDPKPNPKAIDMELDKGKIIGIYELEGGRLTLCVNKIGVAERPGEFTGNPSRFVFVFER